MDGIKEPKKVEMELWKIVPPKEGSDFAIGLFIMEETSAQRGQNRIAISAVWQIFAQKKESDFCFHKRNHIYRANGEKNGMKI